MANFRGDKRSDLTNARVVAVVRPQTGVNPKTQQPLTGSNITAFMANDMLTKKDIEAGKGQASPMLVQSPKEFTAKDGSKHNDWSVPYSDKQAKAIAEHGLDCGKDKNGNQMYVVNTDIMLKSGKDGKPGKALINTESLGKYDVPTKAFNPAKHEKNTKVLQEKRSAERAKLAEKQAPEAEAEASAAMETPTVDEPQA